MASKRNTRSSMHSKKDELPTADVNNGTPRVTRRQSTMNITTTSNSTPTTPCRKKDKLNVNDIINDLEDSDDEFEDPPSKSKNHGKEQNTWYQSSLVDGDSLKVKITKSQPEPNKIEYIIGMLSKEHSTAKNNYKLKSRQSTTHRKSILEDVDEEKKLNPKALKSIQENPTTPKKQNKIEAKIILSPRKRPNNENKPENDQEITSDDEIYSPKNKESSKRVKSSISKGKAIMKDREIAQQSHNDPLNTPSKLMSNLKLSNTPKKGQTPTKAFKNLRIETPTSRPKRKLDINKKEEITNVSVTTNMYNTRPKTPKSYREFNSDDEDGSSEDNYVASESSGDESESEIDVGNEEEFPSKRQKAPRKILSTPKKVMCTPKKTPKKLAEVRTPLVHHRMSNVAKPNTPLQEARQKLHVSVVPKSLPCREEQFNDIYSFLHARLSDGSGGCMYISGVPGTGKTATVNEVIRCLKKSMEANKLTKFDYIDINGMKLSEPRQAYVQILKQLTNRTTSWEEAHKLLHERFTKSNAKKNMTLLLVDELDLLCTKRQDVVYNLLDWPSKIHARLVVVTIANTMDLPERILMGKVTSRLGLTRLTFPPYNHSQLEEIVVSRLRSFNDTFKNETIQLVARKVAAVSGDARRALDICRRATEVAEMNNREIVTMTDVKKALDEMIASPKIQAIRHCSDMEKIFLQAVCSEVTRTGVEEVIFKNVYLQMETLCRLDGQKAPNITETLFLCARLGSWRLLLCDHSRMDIHQRLILNVSTDDVYFATQNFETK